jgi:hypothetical protein
MLAVVKKLPMIDIRLKGDSHRYNVLLKKHYGFDFISRMTTCI